MQPAPALPIVPLTADYWRARGPFLARLYDEHGPVVRALLGRTEVVFLLGPEANRRVLQTHRRSFSHHDGWDWVFGRPPEPPNLLTMDDPQHARSRRALHPAFAVRRAPDYLPLIVRAVDRRLAAWPARAVVDVYEEARVITFDVAAEAILGLRDPAALALGRAVFLHGARHRAGEFSDLLRGVIADRGARPTDDALGLLAGERDEQGCPLDDARILAHAEVILIAGHETSASLAAWALYLLVQHPAYERRARAGRATGSGGARPGAERGGAPVSAGVHRAARRDRGCGRRRLQVTGGDARVLLGRRHAHGAWRLVGPDPLRPGPLRAAA